MAVAFPPFLLHLLLIVELLFDFFLVGPNYQLSSKKVSHDMCYTVVIACVYYAFFNKVGWVCIKKSVATPQVWFHVVPRNHVTKHQMSNMLLHGGVHYIYIDTSFPRHR